MKRFLGGLAVGIALTLVATEYFAQVRAEWLSQYRIAISTPPVPPLVLSRVRAAEATFYADVPAWRRSTEHMQDAAAILAPRLVYKLDLSVGPYRMKPKTIDALLNWAVAEGYLFIEGGADSLGHHALAYFAEQPVLGDWEAAVYLAWLKVEHPLLSDISWADIADDPRHIAKLYSGYMGAGGDMDAWRATIEPGPVALRRMGISGD